MKLFWCHLTLLTCFQPLIMLKEWMLLGQRWTHETQKKSSTEYVLERLQICLCNNNSLFDKNHLLRTNNTATGAPNSCSYSDIAINRLKRFIEKEQTDNFKEFFFFRDDCFVLWKGNKDRLTEFFFFFSFFHS